MTTIIVLAIIALGFIYITCLTATLPCHCFCYIWKNNDTYFSDCYVPRK